METDVEVFGVGTTGLTGLDVELEYTLGIGTLEVLIKLLEYTLGIGTLEVEIEVEVCGVGTTGLTGLDVEELEETLECGMLDVEFADVV